MIAAVLQLLEDQHILHGTHSDDCSLSQSSYLFTFLRDPPRSCQGSSLSDAADKGLAHTPAALAVNYLIAM